MKTQASKTRAAELTERRAYSVASLARAWDCSERTIYEMVESGELKSFTVGKRGTRIPVAEVDRCERDGSAPNGTSPETAPSDGEDNTQLPPSQMRALASVKG